jgi:hypothetical protein
MWISPAESPSDGHFPRERCGEMTTRRGFLGEAPKGAPKVNTHTGDNPVSIYRVFREPCGLRPSMSRGRLLY